MVEIKEVQHLITFCVIMKPYPHLLKHPAEIPAHCRQIGIPEITGEVNAAFFNILGKEVGEAVPQDTRPKQGDGCLGEKFDVVQLTYRRLAVPLTYEYVRNDTLKLTYRLFQHIVAKPSVILQQHPRRAFKRTAMLPLVSHIYILRLLPEPLGIRVHPPLFIVEVP